MKNTIIIYLWVSLLINVGQINAQNYQKTTLQTLDKEWLNGSFYIGENGTYYPIQIDKDKNGFLENQFVHFKGKKYNVGIYSECITITKNNHFGFVFYNSSNNEYRICINGKIFGPFDKYIHYNFLTITEKGNYAFCYYKRGKLYFRINGKKLGPYYNADYYASKIALNEKGDYAFRYYDDEKYQYAICVNGKIVGYSDYDFHSTSITLTKNGKYGFCYENNDSSFVNINGKTLGPYENLREHASSDYYKIILTDNEKYCFKFKRANQFYLNLNKKVFGPFNEIPSYAIYDDDTFYFVYKDNSNRYYLNYNDSIFEINIEGFDSKLKYINLNKDNLSLIWRKTEERSLVEYEFKFGDK